MQELLGNHYLFIKALHLISVISWMAGMLYLPRLYVYHSNEAVGSKTSETFKIMEMKLLRYIMNPAMIATIVFGTVLMKLSVDLHKQSWFQYKMMAVFLMAGCHGYLAFLRKKFLKDERLYTHKFYRYLNEVPTILMITIVILTLTQPEF